MSAKLIQELTQKNITSQQTVLLMKMVELSTVDLENRINDELIENPALEVAPPETEMEELAGEQDAVDNAFDDFFGDDEYGENDWNYKTFTARQPTPNYTFENEFKISVSENLLMQLHEFSLTDVEKVVAKYLIGLLDEKGFLQDEVAQVATELLLEHNLSVTPNEVARVLEEIVQQLEPPGIGARNLQESLILQLVKLEPTEEREWAIEVIRHCFEEFSKKHDEKIQKRLKLSDEKWQKVKKMISRLKPYPVFSTPTQELAPSVVIPDFIISVDDHNIDITSNYQLPNLKVNEEYMQWGKNASQDTALFAKENVDKATLFIHSIQTRESLLQATVAAIVHFQYPFFISGSYQEIKPMVLKDIAEQLGYDISTISRVVKDRYLQTPYGIISLRALFSESVGNDAVSSINIKDKIKEIIENEEKKKPLSDDKIAAILEKEGFPTARRTVAKYREQLGIAVARLRK